MKTQNGAPPSMRGIKGMKKELSLWSHITRDFDHSDWMFLGGFIGIVLFLLTLIGIHWGIKLANVILEMMK